MTADEALDYGLIDEIIAPRRGVAADVLAAPEGKAIEGKAIEGKAADGKAAELAPVGA